MTERKTRKHTVNCYDCNSTLELFEIGLPKATKIMAYRNCGLFHYYKKDFLGNYQLTKVQDS